jgi:STE24 endopeptidase
MKSALPVTVLAFVAALAWGIAIGNSPAAPRSTGATRAVSSEWYAALPRDASMATTAYLERVPKPMLMRGSQMDRTRYWVLAARIIGTMTAGALALFSGAAAQLASALSAKSRHRWLTDLLFASCLFVFFFAILLPIDVYAGYVRPRQFGFADQAFLSWLQDYAVETAIMALFEAIGLTVIMALMRHRPRSWIALATAVYFALSGAYVLLTPLVIEPLSNSYSPVPDSAIKRQILTMAHANGVPAQNVYVDDASRQTRLLNAHVSGVGGTARIALDDNLLNDPHAPSILWVVAHEMGHYVHRDLFGGILFSTLVAGAGFVFIALAGTMAIRVGGRRWRIGTLSETAAIPVFWTAFLIFGFLSLPVENAFNLWQEARADRFGLDVSREPDGMAEFMIHDPDNTSVDPATPALVLFYDHPSTRSRVEAAMMWREAHAGERP